MVRDAAPSFPVNDAQFFAGATQASMLPKATLPEIAFAGRSNVGKSSLLNALLLRNKLVRTSRTPGCTRQLNLFQATLGGGPSLVVADLPGYGFAQRAKTEKATWGKMIEGYLLEREALRALVLLVDVRRGVEEDDAQLTEFWDQTEKPLLVVATKIDKISMSQRKTALAAFSKGIGARVIGFSAETGEGRDELWRAVLRTLAPKAAIDEPSARGDRADAS